MVGQQFRGALARAAFNAIPPGALAACALVVAGCGGGGYGSSMSAPPPPPAGVAKVSLNLGAISSFSGTGFSVNGMQFQATGAAVTVDGNSATLDALQVGDVVEVKGHHDDGSDQDIADDVDLRGNVEGPVSVIDAAAQTLTVLGQKIAISANTSFDDDIVPASLAGLKVGDLVEVSGMAAADGSIHATRVERRSAGTAFMVVGRASATDAAGKTLTINTLVVDFSGATLNGFGSEGPQDGELVVATGAALAQNGALQATQLQLLPGQDAPQDPADEARVEGLITRFVSVSDFDVAGRAVSTSSATEFDGGNAAALAINVRVEVEGVVDSDGVLQARKLEIGQAADVRLTAQVAAVDTGAGILTVLGTTAAVDDNTRLEDHGSGKVRSFGLGDIRAGDWLEVRGTSVGTGSSSIAASRVDRVQPQSQVRLMGLVQGVALPSFTVLDTTVAVSPQTQFSGGIDSTVFFATATGNTVSVRGAWDGSTLAADKVQLGDDHGDDGDDD